MAESRTDLLRRIHAHAGRDAWDGPAVFHEACARHGGLQLAKEKRPALARLVRVLLWGELVAWMVSADLALRLEDPDARLAASSQVFDEARHFYVLRDYLALLHVEVPDLDPYFTAAVRSILHDDDLTFRLMATQLLVEGMALATFQFLSQSGVEPVLSDILPSVERDESRHVGLGMLYLPRRLDGLSAHQCRSLARRVARVDMLVTLSSVQEAAFVRDLGLDPRDLHTRVSGHLFGLSRKLGPVPGTGQPYFTAYDPGDPDWVRQRDMLLGEGPPDRLGTWVRRVVAFGARSLPR